jgi:hypothetical protein
MDACGRCTNLEKKILRIMLPSMVEAENFSVHPCILLQLHVWLFIYIEGRLKVNVCVYTGNKILLYRIYCAVNLDFITQYNCCLCHMSCMTVCMIEEIVSESTSSCHVSCSSSHMFFIMFLCAAGIPRFHNTTQMGKGSKGIR